MTQDDKTENLVEQSRFWKCFISEKKNFFKYLDAKQSNCKLGIKTEQGETLKVFSKIV